MTAPPWQSSGDPRAAAQPGMRAGGGARAGFRNYLGVAQLIQATAFTAAGPVGAPGLQVGPGSISQRFIVGPESLTVETGAGTPEQFADTVRKRLRKTNRGYKFGPVSPAQVAGYQGVARALTGRKRRGKPAPPPATQMYTVVGPYAVTVTLTGPAQPALGSLGLYPAAPPVITPVVRLPDADPLSVEERLTISRGSIKLTAILSSGNVTGSADAYATGVLRTLQSQLADLAVDNSQPDVFLGGQPCVRAGFLRGGLRGQQIRSEFWWAGVVGGRGIQLLVSGTKSIISLQEALPLRDVVVLLPPD